MAWKYPFLYSTYRDDRAIIKLCIEASLFSNYFLHMSDVTFDMSKNTMDVHQRSAEPWRVTLVDTGETTATGGRPERIRILSVALGIPA